MAIMADEIQDIDGRRDAPNVLYQYIKYMHEQLEFWGTNRQREINELRAEINELRVRVAALEEAQEE